jgi:hypothetical protein
MSENQLDPLINIDYESFYSRNSSLLNFITIALSV